MIKKKRRFKVSDIFDNNKSLEEHRDFKKYANISFGAWCGMLMGDKTAGKFATIQKQFVHDVKALLSENLDDIKLSEWTLDYSDGNQRTVTFHSKENDNDDSKLERIKVLNTPSLFNSRKEKNVFNFKNHEHAREVVLTLKQFQDKCKDKTELES